MTEMMRKMAALSAVITESISSPLIVILGSTGVGKSKLGIELAKRINGEVVSADSMQVYKGLDIITAKVTYDEQEECKHHMIDVVSPLDNFNVVDFRNMALPIISDIFARKKIPIVVGGTNYYIESLLWNILVESDASVDEKRQNCDTTEENIEIKEYRKSSASSEKVAPEAKNDNNKTEDKDKYCDTTEENIDNKEYEKSSASSENIASKDKSDNNKTEDKDKREVIPSSDDDYKRLKIIDPIAASKVHPNDKRKVKRKLQISEMNGESSTEIYKRQKNKEGSDHLGGPLRFKKTLVFWLCCEENILRDRLSKRVDDMLKKGLVEEISNFYSEYKKNLPTRNSGSEPYSEGLFQAIGFKEFHNFLTKRSDVDDGASQKMLQDGIDALKQVTVRYSKKQSTWIRNRFLKRPEWSSPKVYQLDTSVLDQWEENVLKPALKATEEFLKGDKITLEPVPKIKKDPNESPHRQYVCDICNGRLIVGDAIWSAHCKSRKHRKLAAKKRKFEEL